jgi:hypothetical protein
VSADERALSPEDLTRLFVERANERDAAGIAAPTKGMASWPIHQAGTPSACCGRR